MNQDYFQKLAESQKDVDQFLEQKYAARSAAAKGDPNYIDPKIMKLESKESKVTTLAKGAISNIDWSLDGSKIVVCFKQHNQIVVWNVINCQKIIQIDFSTQQEEIVQPKNASWGPSPSQSVWRVQFDKLNDNYLLISGQEAYLIMID